MLMIVENNMRTFAALTALIAIGCSTATNPGGKRAVGVISGYTPADPRIDLIANGRSVQFRVTTYGGPCDSAGETSVRVSGLNAEVMPFDYRGDCGARSLRTIEHVVTINFKEFGTARITVRGVDASTRTAANPVGDTVAVTRELVLR
jgi:hypothetical protein